MSSRQIKKGDRINQGNEQLVEVLYQKMGDRWFAFSIVDEEVFIGSVSQDEIDTLESGRSPKDNKVHRFMGNS